MVNLRKFDNLLHFIDDLNTDVHLLVISETWVNSLNRFAYSIKNYSSVFSFRDDKVGGGLAMYIRNDITYNISNIDDGTMPFQYVCIKLLQFNSASICGIYRPPSTDMNLFLEFLDNFLHSNKFNSDFILVGDMNVPVNKSDKFISDYNSTLFSHGMIVTNTHSTRPESGNILDHVICSFLNIDQVSNSTIESDISDHNLIFSKLTFKAKYEFRKLDKKIVNHTKVNELFDGFLFSNSFDMRNPDLTLKLILAKYNELVEKFSVVKHIRVKIKNFSNCPWMSFDLWKLIKTKNRTLQRLKLNVNNTELRKKLDTLNKKDQIWKVFCKKLLF